MFLPVAIFVFLGAVYAWKTISLYRSGNRANVRRGVVLVSLMFGFAALYGSILLAHTDNPLAWGFGPSVLCKAYGGC